MLDFLYEQTNRRDQEGFNQRVTAQLGRFFGNCQSKAPVDYQAWEGRGNHDESRTIQNNKNKFQEKKE